jgi:hypothetical protein
MNFIEARKTVIEQINKLKIKHCPDSIIEDNYNNYICNKCFKSSLLVIANAGVYLNIKLRNGYNNDGNYSGFVLKDSRSYNDGDIILELDEFLNILNLQDFEKYEEKYNSLILFK